MVRADRRSSIYALLAVLPSLARLLTGRARAAGASLSSGGWRHEAIPTAATRRRASPSSVAPCPTSPACICSATGAGRVVYVGKAKSVRKRVASHFAKAQVPSSPGHAEMVAERRADRVRRRGHRGRGAAGRAELHQAVPAAFQHPAARRQVLPVHRDLARRGVSARLLHTRAPPCRARLLRTVLERQARAGHARGARQGVHVPLLHRPRAGAAQRQPVPGLLHQALRGAVRGLRLRGGLPPRIDGRDRLPLRPLPGDRA